MFYLVGGGKKKNQHNKTNKQTTTTPNNYLGSGAPEKNVPFYDPKEDKWAAEI